MLEDKMLNGNNEDWVRAALMRVAKTAARMAIALIGTCAICVASAIGLPSYRLSASHQQSLPVFVAAFTR